MPPEPRVGVHLAIAAGLDHALAEAKRLRIGAAQIFSKSPRQWAAGKLDLGRLARFDAQRRELGVSTLAVHASYLLNVASPLPSLRERSIRGLAEELERAAAFRAEYLVLHPGSSSGEADREAVARRTALAVRSALKRARAPGVTLLLENAAAERGDVGADLRELAALIERIGAPGLVGVCLDTCHAFQAGYDLRDRRGVNAFARELERTVGSEVVRLVHANDSKQVFGGRLDRHQHIGRGHIGRAVPEQKTISPGRTCPPRARRTLLRMPMAPKSGRSLRRPSATSRCPGSMRKVAAAGSTSGVL
ncbi:MAG: deoxyribonuclease IV [Elusimicrobia bacterium]|nr:deoxyribonuclease IV [Elusimicrobiota bacterium]